MGIGKRELMCDYYIDEICDVFAKYMEFENDVKTVSVEDFF